MGPLILFWSSPGLKAIVDPPIACFLACVVCNGCFRFTSDVTLGILIFTTITTTKPVHPSSFNNLFHLILQTSYDRGRSFFSLYKASRETLATLTTLNRTPGISPTAWPFLPNPATNTSSFSCNTNKHGLTDNSTYLRVLLEWTPVTNRFLCRNIHSNDRKFGYNEHPFTDTVNFFASFYS